RLSDGNHWRSLGDSNPCFRRERATSWAARRREQAESFGDSADHRPAQGEPAVVIPVRWIVIAGHSASKTRVNALMTRPSIFFARSLLRKGSTPGSSPGVTPRGWGGS